MWMFGFQPRAVVDVIIHCDTLDYAHHLQDMNQMVHTSKENIKIAQECARFYG